MHSTVFRPVGQTVPWYRRSWSRRWRGYSPVDVTPPELYGEGLAASVAQGWAEPYPTPADVPDWDERHAAAIVPFCFDDWGRPLNPTGRTGRSGRNLGRWGENPAADPIVVAGHGTSRRVLLIKRSDTGLWAIPGGMVDPGETAPAALVRELREETGVDLVHLTPQVIHRGYVEDRRNTDHAWVCTTAALYRLPGVVPATGMDDALAADWWPFTSLAELTAAITATGGQLDSAHLPLLLAAQRTF